MYPTIGQIVNGEEHMPTVIESLCMNCHEQGTTRLLFTTIPFFKEVIIMSFRCPHCGYSSNEIQPGGAVQDRGCIYNFSLNKSEDLQRHIVKSESAVIRIPELEFEIPKGKGVLTTLEGLLSTVIENLSDSQEDRRKATPEIADQVELFMTKLSGYSQGSSLPFTLVIDDPSGNSFLENPDAPKTDPQMKITEYIRTKEQQEGLGLSLEEYEVDELPVIDEGDEAPAKHVKDGSTMKHDESFVKDKEVFQMESDCPNCTSPGVSKTCLTDIPFFKEIIIMAFKCEECGFKSNEIKGGGAIPTKGNSITLRINKRSDDPETFDSDMQRDVVKSNTAGVFLPELDIEVTNGSLGGMYTTVEGLLTLIKEKLFDGQASEMYKGDSAMEHTRIKFQELETRFDQLLAGEFAFTIVLHDPLANSYIYSECAPEPEERLTEAEFERSFEDNEELGLNDMCTENYEEMVNTPDIRKPQVVFDNDDHLDFEGPFDTFQGSRPNMVFRLGTKGVGYYSENQEASVFAKMRSLQEDGKATHPRHIDAPI